jgi:hypothetical protein
MYKYEKSGTIAIFLMIIAALALLQIKTGTGQLQISEDKTLTFLSEVAQIELRNCTIDLHSVQISYPDEYGGLPQERVRYVLSIEESKLDATCIFVNGTYTYCVLNWVFGNPVYSTLPSTDLLDATKTILEQYQSYSKSLNVTSMSNTLNSISKAENTDILTQDTRLKISTSGNNTDFAWSKKAQQIEIPGLEVIWHGNTLWSINDRWSVFLVGNDKISVSEEEAISLALNMARNCSWTVNGTTIEDYELSTEIPMTRLSMNVRQPMTLFPLWTVYVWLEPPYKGGIDTITVGIWADNGEISFVRPIGHGLSLQQENEPISQSGFPSVSLLVVIVSAIIIFSSLMLILKRHKKNK